MSLSLSLSLFLSLPFITSVSNKAAGLFIAFRPVRSWEQTGCSQVTWFTAMGNLSSFSPGSHGKLLLFSSPRFAFYSPKTVTLVSSPSASSSPLSLFHLLLSLSLCSLSSSLFFPFHSPLFFLLLLPCTLSSVMNCSLCSIFATIRLCSAAVEAHILLHPLLWICSALICRMDTECSSRQADILQRLQILKDCIILKE